MDLLGRLLGHDAWMTAELLRRCRELTDVQLDRAFDIDHGSVRALLSHMIGNVEVWTELLDERWPDASARHAWSGIEGLILRHDNAYARFASTARRIEVAGRINDTFLDVLDDPPSRKSFGGAIAHVITHNMHHRAHVLLVLGWLGLAGLPEGDILGWEGRNPP